MHRGSTQLVPKLIQSWVPISTPNCCIPGPGTISKGRSVKSHYESTKKPTSETYSEDIADTYHDQIRRGQHKSQNEQQLLQNAGPDSEEYMISMQNLIPHAGNVLFALGGGAF